MDEQLYDLLEMELDKIDVMLDPERFWKLMDLYMHMLKTDLEAELKEATIDDKC